jgi:nucleoside-diphosphate-sugar epimerase
VLVVGCGVLGLRVARGLKARSVAVAATTRSPDRAAAFAAEGIAPVVCDILDPASLAGLPEVDAVFHAVASDRSSGVPMRTLYVDGLRNVLDRLAGRVGRFVLAGSTGVYGQSDGSWVDEDAPTEPATESGRVGLEAEAVLRQSGVPATVLRFAGLYGPERLPRRAALERGEPVAGDPEHFLNLIHLDDAATAALAALLATTPEPGPLYVVADGHPVSRRDFYGAMAEFLRLPPPAFAVGPAAGDRAGRDASHKRVRADRIGRELGVSWRYPDFRAGLAACLAADPPPEPGRLA